MVEGEKQEMEIGDYDTDDKPSSIAFVGKKNVFSLAFVGRNEFGIIHPEHKALIHEVDSPFDKLDDKTRELAMKSTEELFGIIKSIHPFCFPKRLLRKKLEQSKKQSNG